MGHKPELFTNLIFIEGCIFIYLAIKNKKKVVLCRNTALFLGLEGIYNKVGLLILVPQAVITEKYGSHGCSVGEDGGFAPNISR